MRVMISKLRLSYSHCLAAAFAALAAGMMFFCHGSALAAVSVTVSGPGGMAEQSLPDDGGTFDVNLPLTRNSVNTIVVTARDANGNTASREISVTQVSLDQIVVSRVTSERLSVEEVEQLVAEGIIDLKDPENYNVSTFDIVLTVGNQPVPISIPIAVPVNEPESTGYEVYRMTAGDQSSGKPNPPQIQIVVFDMPASSSAPGEPAPPRIPGVIIIEGNIKSLKEFFSVRLLLMNTSGIFTLSNVMADIQLPEGKLSYVLPSDGINSFGEILPGDGTQPGQKEREFIIRGDAIGIHDLTVNFGGTVTGPGIDEPIPFSGSAVTNVEVKGPPKFLVEVTHPDSVQAGVPYDLQVDITNTGDLTAMYASLELGVAGDALIESCITDTDGDPVCDYGAGPAIRPFGHIFPGETVRETFTILPSQSGVISSCVAAADQNITLNVYTGSMGCQVGQYAPKTAVADGIPTVTVVPASNTTGIHEDSAVTAFFSEKMNKASIVTGSGGAFNVFDGAGDRVPGILRFEALFEGTDKEKTIAVWQVNDGVTNRLASNATYTVVLTTDILDIDGNRIANRWESTFTTTDTGINDTTSPTISMSVAAPVNPNAVLPGEIVNINAYASDAGSGISRVEMRIKDLGIPGELFTLVGQKTVFNGDAPPYIFAIDSSNLVPGHVYQAMGTAYDAIGNAQNSTLALMLLGSAAPPTITLPDDLPGTVLQGIGITLQPECSAGVRTVAYYIDGSAMPYKTVTLPPFQASLSTLTLGLGNHTILVRAEDGLGQQGIDTYDFSLLQNPNEPVVGFSGLVDGARYTSGSSILITGTADDPVGVANISYWLDNTGSAPLYSGFSPILLNTTGISTGNHKVYIQAINALGAASDLGDPEAAFEFMITAPGSGSPPPAPNISTTSFPSGGLVTLSGTSMAGARVEITNVNIGISTTIYATSAGLFTGQVPGDAGHQISVVTYDDGSSEEGSNPSFAVVPAEPVLNFITVNPESMTFNQANAYSDIVVTGHYQGGATANLTSSSVFSSATPTVASVSSSGRVAAQGNGDTTITASVNGRSAQVPVTVDIVTLQSISVHPEIVNLAAPGQTEALTVTGHYSNGTNTELTTGLTFVSGNPSVATVGMAGVVTAVGEGDTQISVSHAGASPVAVMVTVDPEANAAPEVTDFTAPSEAEPGDSIDIHLEAQDDLGIVSLNVALLDGASVIDEEVRTFASGEKTVSEDITLTIPDTMAPGTELDIKATVVDTGAKSGSDESVLTIVDLTPPEVTLTQPANQQQFNPGDTVTVTVTATDLVGVDTIGYTATGAISSSEDKTVPETTSGTESFQFTIPTGTSGEITLQARAEDASGNEGFSDTLTIKVSGGDISAPETIVTAVNDTADPSVLHVLYEVLSGFDDLDHVELFFRRNGIGTFNRYTVPTSGNADEQAGIFNPSTSMGSIDFDSIRMGGNGAFEFYTVGFDADGNREPAPVSADMSGDVDDPAYTSVVITTEQTITAADHSLDGANLVVNSATLIVDGVHAFGNIDLLNGAVLKHSNTSISYEAGTELTIWTLSVDASSTLDVTGLGYLGGGRGDNNQTTGRTLGNVNGAGIDVAGSYGGLGANAMAGALYGDALDPFELGSGGGTGDSGTAWWGGNGGGRIRITAVNVTVDGGIYSNGSTARGADAGSGSGGAINIETTTLSGAGSITANGGSHETSGGGGRIAVRYTDMSTYDAGRIQATGGAAGSRGGDGTVLLKGAGETYGSLIIDGKNVVGPSTASRIFGGTYDNITLRNGARVVADDPVVVTGRLLLENNSILTHTTATLDRVFGLDLTVGHLEIDAGSAIDAGGRGYLGGAQGGADNRGRTLGNLAYNPVDAAGSYGGRGNWVDQAGNPVYGSITDPYELGSGGGTGDSGTAWWGGNGGGRIRIDADTMIVNGAIRSNGGTAKGADAGSGSGGSVNLTTGTLSGSGTIEAKGGSHETSGGGGRISVRYDSMSGFDNQNIQAFGGTSGRAGGPGTVYLEGPDAPEGLLIVDGGGYNYYTYWWASGNLPTAGPRMSTEFIYDSGTNTTELIDAGIDTEFLQGALVGQYLTPDVFGYAGGPFEIVANTEDSITVRGNMTTAASAGDTYALVYHFDKVLVRDGAVLCVSDLLEADDDIQLTNNGTLSHLGASTVYEPWLWLSTGDLTIDATSRIDVTGLGYLGGGRGDNNQTTGRTLGNVNGAGIDVAGSYGGLGANAMAGALYGDALDPFELGSGGGTGDSGTAWWGGNGGGRIRITAVNVTVDGGIYSNGSTARGADAGSGSGGAINIETTTLSGAGSITANGGSHETSGGGGRIAVRYTDMSTYDAGRIQATGGAAGSRGGDGTVLLKGAGETYGSLIIDGKNVVGPSTASRIFGGTYDNITLRNGARVVADDPVVVTGRLLLENNSILTHTTATLDRVFGLDLTVGHLEIDAGSAIDAGGRGYLGGAQGGADNRGRTLGNLAYNPVDAAGSYGGRGNWVDQAGNPVYGSITDPYELGSGGGTGDSGTAWWGGNGGGRIRIDADTMIVNGAIRSNGGTAKGADAGSGSGGSVNLTTGTLSGSGTIEAKGGSHETSGGGGRISVRYDSMSGFDNQNIQAFGGTSGRAGGPGTVYLEGPDAPEGLLIVDGGGYNYYTYWWASGNLPTAGPRMSTEFIYDSGTNTTELIDAGIDTEFLQGALVGQYLTPDVFGYAGSPFEIVANTEDSITVRGNMTTAASAGDTYALVYHFDKVLVRDGAVLCVSDLLEADDDIQLTNNGTLSHLGASTVYEPWLWLSTGDLTIDATSRIDVTGLGYLGGGRGGNNQTTGRTLGNVNGAGIDVAGSYGGLGANASAGALYGDALDPFELGSGGGTGDSGTAWWGGNGGGRIRITAVNVTVDGGIYSNGSTARGADAGSGSGGAINIETTTLSGAGSITANGGSHETSGGGGRIAVRLESPIGSSPSIQANGGTAGRPGSNGTVHIEN